MVFPSLRLFPQMPAAPLLLEVSRHHPSPTCPQVQDFCRRQAAFRQTSRFPLLVGRADSLRRRCWISTVKALPVHLALVDRLLVPAGQKDTVHLRDLETGGDGLFLWCFLPGLGVTTFFLLLVVVSILFSFLALPHSLNTRFSTWCQPWERALFVELPSGLPQRQSLGMNSRNQNMTFCKGNG